MKTLTRYFLEGLFILLPVALTIAMMTWLVGFLSRQFGPNTFIGGYLKMLGFRVAGDSMAAYLIGWLIVIGIIFLLGFIVDHGARKYIKRTIDLIMERIPLINKLYKISVQIVQMVDKKGSDEFKGMSVVYCFFGGENGTAFLALKPTQQTFVIREVEYNVVLIPTAPVPVGGGLMLVPSASVQPADMPIEDFMQVYISMGASTDDIIPKGTVDIVKEGN
jgi:uncharacterized membrane protein